MVEEVKETSSNINRKISIFFIGLFFILMLVVAAIAIISVLGNSNFTTTNTSVSKISVTGDGVVRSAPDFAELSIGVVSESDSVASAQDDNNTRIAAIKSALKELGIADADISTSRFNIYPSTQITPCVIPMNSNEPSTGSAERGTDASSMIYPVTPSCAGSQIQRVEQYLDVIVRDIASTGKAIDAATRSGATNIDSVAFKLNDAHQKDLSSQARDLAVKSAREKADQIAKSGGVGIARTFLISEQTYYSPYMYADAKAISASNTSTTIAPGDLDVRVNVSVEYEIK